MTMYKEIIIDGGKVFLKAAISKADFNKIFRIAKGLTKESPNMQKLLKEVKKKNNTVLYSVFEKAFNIISFLCIASDFIESYNLDDDVWNMLDVGYQCLKRDKEEQKAVS